MRRRLAANRGALSSSPATTRARANVLSREPSWLRTCSFGPGRILSRHSALRDPQTLTDYESPVTLPRRSTVHAWLCVTALLVGACRGGEGPAWQKYEAADGSFSVEFPGRPTASSRQDPTSFLLTTVHTIVLNRGPVGILQVAHYDLLKEAQELPVEPWLKIDCLQPYTSSNFRPTEPVGRSIGGRPAIAITGIAPKSDSLPNGGWQQNVCVVIGERMYHLIAIGPDNQTTRQDADRFMGSFQPRETKE